MVLSTILCPCLPIALSVLRFMIKPLPLKHEFGQFNFIIIFVCEIILLPKKIKDFVCTFFCGIDYIS
jgi:hypothetical protein